MVAEKTQKLGHQLFFGFLLISGGFLKNRRTVRWSRKCKNSAMNVFFQIFCDFLLVSRTTLVHQERLQKIAERNDRPFLVSVFYSNKNEKTDSEKLGAKNQFVKFIMEIISKIENADELCGKKIFEKIRENSDSEDVKSWTNWILENFKNSGNSGELEVTFMIGSREVSGLARSENSENSENDKFMVIMGTIGTMGTMSTMGTLGAMGTMVIMGSTGAMGTMGISLIGESWDHGDNGYYRSYGYHGYYEYYGYYGYYRSLGYYGYYGFYGYYGKMGNFRSKNRLF
ncbi:Protein CBG00901 [Caenorhabditis briggsae]|uniref:Protein CBG00901 n=1 Tax=Caenorhabditis briggsae TaxID=6238 RepID=A8WPD1_CAEBR|nr:Protein CBG00901 [Caenorhabditis briggsae]CAP22337.1 Protein CBG00901 [Caenorhabditis briggsae]